MQVISMWKKWSEREEFGKYLNKPLVLPTQHQGILTAHLELQETSHKPLNSGDDYIWQEKRKGGAHEASHSSSSGVCFQPSWEEDKWSQRVCAAIEQQEEKGKGQKKGLQENAKEWVQN